MKSLLKFAAMAAITMTLLSETSTTFAADGMITVKSNHSVSDTADKLESVLQEKGMKIFARIDHAAGAAGIGQEMRPTELIIFGNPKVGTGMMLCAQSVGIDLPMKALIWQDEEGNNWLGYNDPQFLKSRHQMEGCDGLIDKVSGALANFSKAATSP